MTNRIRPDIMTNIYIVPKREYRDTHEGCVTFIHSIIQRLAVVSTMKYSPLTVTTLVYVNEVQRCCHDDGIKQLVILTLRYRAWIIQTE